MLPFPALGCCCHQPCRRVANWALHPMIPKSLVYLPGKQYRIPRTAVAHARGLQFDTSGPRSPRTWLDTVKVAKAQPSGVLSGCCRSNTAGRVVASQAPRKREVPWGSAPASSWGRGRGAG